jgi:hypothetical protein
VHYTKPRPRTPTVSGAAATELAGRGGALPATLSVPPIPVDLAPAPTQISTPTPTSTATPTATPTATAIPSTPQKLAEETAALDTARRALGAGAVPRALGALDDYGRDFPNGLLSPEATVLRIEALARRGDDAAALAAARSFLASHPTSTHARRVRSLVEGMVAKSPPSGP